MPAEGRENPLLKKGNSDAFFREKYLTKNIPGGNGIFTATPTERITHYTLQAKSCAKGQAPLETPDNKTG